MDVLTFLSAYCLPLTDYRLVKELRADYRRGSFAYSYDLSPDRYLNRCNGAPVAPVRSLRGNVLLSHQTGQTDNEQRRQKPAEGVQFADGAKKTAM